MANQIASGSGSAHRPACFRSAGWMAGVLALLLLSPSAYGQEAPRRHKVAVDWAGVPDATIQQCGLMGFEGLLLQHLLDAELAVVQDPQAADITAKIHVDQNQLLIESNVADDREQTRLPIPVDCESTIQLDLIHELLGQLERLKSRHPIPVSTPPPYRVLLGAAVMIPGELYPLPCIQSAGWVRMGDGWEVGGGIEGCVGYYGGILVVEPLGQGTVQWGHELVDDWFWAVGVEIGVLGHVYQVKDERGGHADVRIGVPLRVVGANVAISAEPFFRRTAVEHVFSGDEAYASAHWGLSIGVAAVIF